MTPKSDKEIREQLLAHGVESLSDNELLAIVLGADSSVDDSAVAAEALLDEETLPQLSHKTVPQLRKVAGLGIRRATRAAAAFELGRRVRIAESSEQTVIRDRNDIVSLFEPILSGLDHEEMWVVYLASSNRIIERRKVAQGGSSALSTDCKLILKRAVELVASSMIIVHNHPSGRAVPSDEDTALTIRLKEAAALFDIALLDHIIIGAGDNYSFRADKIV